MGILRLGFASGLTGIAVQQFARFALRSTSSSCLCSPAALGLHSISINASLLSMSPLDAQIGPNHPFLARRHFPPFVLSHVEETQMSAMIIAKSKRIKVMARTCRGQKRTRPG
jgi:hypothetical protein